MQIPAYVTRVDQICYGCYEAVVDPPGTLCPACQRPQVGDTVLVEEPVDGRMWLLGLAGEVVATDGDVLSVEFIVPSRSGRFRTELVALGIEEVGIWLDADEPS